MSNLRNTIDTLASQFAVSIIEALRGASIDELLEVAGGAGSSVRRARPVARATHATVETESAAPRKRGGRGGRLGRRSATDIAQMIDAIVDLLGKNPGGLRAEQIREALACEAKELPRPLAEAMTTGRITKSGQKRATTYFAGSGTAPAKRRGRKAGPARRKRG